MVWWIFFVVFFALLGIALFSKCKACIWTGEKGRLYLRLKLIGITLFQRIFLFRLKNYIRPEVFIVKKEKLVPLETKTGNRPDKRWKLILDKADFERVNIHIRLGTGDKTVL